MATVQPGQRKRPISDINVVPYIDVMLVLLVIFMITAPLLTQGVNVELPEAASEPMESDSQEPLVVSVNREGQLFLNVGENTDAPIEGKDLTTKVAAVLRNKPNTPVMVRGDNRAEYGHVVQAMVLLQAAGAPNVGLITQPPPPARKK